MYVQIDLSNIHIANNNKNYDNSNSNINSYNDNSNNTNSSWLSLKAITKICQNFIRYEEAMDSFIIPLAQHMSKNSKSSSNGNDDNNNDNNYYNN